jgi:hypothetical protein
MKGFVTNKVAWLFASLHAVLFGIGMYQRNGVFHFIYEPLVLQILIVVDVLWLWLSDFLGLGTLNEPSRGLLFMGIAGCFQWFAIGYLVNRLIGRKSGELGQAKVQQLFQFPATWISEQRSIPLVIKGDRKWIEQFISVDELGEIFGGYATWRPPDEPTEMMRGEGLGVWGKRNISKFRRILRERGAEFEVIDGEGPKQRIWTT